MCIFFAQRLRISPFGNSFLLFFNKELTPFADSIFDFFSPSIRCSLSFTACGLHFVQTFSFWWTFYAGHSAEGYSHCGGEGDNNPDKQRSPKDESKRLLKVAATYSPTMQRSTIGDAVCAGAAALSARLCRAPLRPPPPVPSLCALCLAPRASAALATTPARYFSHHDYKNLWALSI